MLEAVRLRETEDRGRPPNERAHPWRLGMEGQGRTRVLLFLLFLAALAYLGNQVAGAYVNYLALRDTVQVVVRDVALRPSLGVEEGTERILAKARELEMSLSERQVILTVSEEAVVGRVRWEQPIGVEQYTIPFPFEIEESYLLVKR